MVGTAVVVMCDSFVKNYFLDLFYFEGMSVLLACMYVPSEEVVRFSELGVSSGCELPCGCWEQTQVFCKSNKCSYNGVISPAYIFFFFFFPVGALVDADYVPKQRTVQQIEPPCAQSCSLKACGSFCSNSICQG